MGRADLARPDGVRRHRRRRQRQGDDHVERRHVAGVAARRCGGRCRSTRRRPPCPSTAGPLSGRHHARVRPGGELVVAQPAVLRLGPTGTDRATPAVRTDRRVHADALLRVHPRRTRTGVPGAARSPPQPHRPSDRRPARERTCRPGLLGLAGPGEAHGVHHVGIRCGHRRRAVRAPQPELRPRQLRSRRQPRGLHRCCRRRPRRPLRWCARRRVPQGQRVVHHLTRMASVVVGARRADRAVDHPRRPRQPRDQDPRLVRRRRSCVATASTPTTRRLLRHHIGPPPLQRTAIPPRSRTARTRPAAGDTDDDADLATVERSTT